jgi:hypothetical protein
MGATYLTHRTSDTYRKEGRKDEMVWTCNTHEETRNMLCWKTSCNGVVQARVQQQVYLGAGNESSQSVVTRTDFIENTVNHS